MPSAMGSQVLALHIYCFLCVLGSLQWDTSGCTDVCRFTDDVFTSTPPSSSESLSHSHSTSLSSSPNGHRHSSSGLEEEEEDLTLRRNVMAMFGAAKVLLWIRRRRKPYDHRLGPLALALLFLVLLGAYNALQRYNMRVAALNRLARLGRRYHEPFYGPPTQPTAPRQQHRRPLMSSRAATAAHGRVPNRLRRRSCVKRLTANNRSAADGHPWRQQWQCNYTADSGAGFVVLENFVECERCPVYEENNVTLVTHASSRFLRHIPELCDRWQGPLSVAVFAPGSDFGDALSTIATLRQCSRNPCVRGAVTWHLVYDQDHTPTSLANDSAHPWYTLDRRRSDQLCSSREPHSHPEARSSSMPGLPYPANVLRNVARRLAPTRYVLVQDVRLYPSANIVPRFLSHVAEQRRLRSIKDGHDAFVLPVFEASSLRKEGSAAAQQWVPPRTMGQLEDSLRSGMVAPSLDDPSHGGALWSRLFPATNATGPRNKSSEDEETRERLGVFETFKRNRTVQFWEPVFLGTKEDPAYDERFFWETGGDRVSQGYLMCLKDYNFHIMGGAFLIRVPEANGETDGGPATISGPSNRNMINFEQFKFLVASKYSSELRERC